MELTMAEVMVMAREGGEKGGKREEGRCEGRSEKQERTKRGKVSNERRKQKGRGQGVKEGR